MGYKVYRKVDDNEIIYFVGTEEQCDQFITDSVFTDLKKRKQ